jgi:hypothetical protein
MLGVNAIFEYSFVHPGGKQFSVIDPSTGTPLLPYWMSRELTKSFPVGSTIIEARSDRQGIDTLAVRVAGGAIHVLVVNRLVVAGSREVGGPGLPLKVELELGRVGQGGTLSARMLDGETPLATGPIATARVAGTHATLVFSGYGAAIVTYEPPR